MILFLELLQKDRARTTHQINIKDTVMQIEKALINDRFHVSKVYNPFLLYFLFINKTLRLNNLKPRTAMDAKISVFVVGVEAIIYLLLYNLHDCTFKILATELFKINLSNNIMVQLIFRKTNKIGYNHCLQIDFSLPQMVSSENHSYLKSK